MIARIFPSRRHQKKGQICLVASGKGGVGKTWFTLTAAHQLAGFGEKVLLIDGDLGMANVDIQLNLMPRYNLSHFINGYCSLPQAVTHYEPGNFDIIAGCSGTGNMAALPFHKLVMLREALSNLAATYDYVLIDLGAGIGELTYILLPLISELWMVATPEPTSLTDVYAYIKMVLQRDRSLPIKILVNQASHVTQGQKVYQTLAQVCARFLNKAMEELGILTESYRIPTSIRHQQFLSLMEPQSVPVREVRKMMHAIIQQRQEAPQKALNEHI